MCHQDSKDLNFIVNYSILNVGNIFGFFLFEEATLIFASRHGETDLDEGGLCFT